MVVRSPIRADRRAVKGSHQRIRCPKVGLGQQGAIAGKFSRMVRWTLGNRVRWAGQVDRSS